MMAVLEGKQSGSATIIYTEDYVEATVSAYTLAQSILLFTHRGGDAEPDEGCIRGWKVDTTTLRFERDDLDRAPIIIEWQLLEFDTDVDIQDIQRTNNGQITVNAITAANTFVVPGGYENNGNTFGGDDWLRVWLSDTTTCDFASEDDAPSSVRNAQVVEFTGCDVQHFSNNYSGTGQSDTQTITEVTQANTGLFSSMSTSVTPFDDALWRMRLTSTTVVTFDRQGNGNDSFDWELYVAEFTDGTTLQQGIHTLADTDAQDDITIDEVTIAECAVNMGGSGPNYGTHGSTGDTNDDPRDSFVTVIFLDTTTIQIDRVETNSALELAYQVWEWNTAAPPAGGDLQLLVDGGVMQLLVDGGVIQKIVD